MADANLQNNVSATQPHALIYAISTSNQFSNPSQLTKISLSKDTGALIRE